MDEIKKIKYEKPEIVDFKWMDAMGVCSTGSGDPAWCSSNGNNAGSTCSNGYTPGGLCTSYGGGVA